MGVGGSERAAGGEGLLDADAGDQEDDGAEGEEVECASFADGEESGQPEEFGAECAEKKKESGSRTALEK